MRHVDYFVDYSNLSQIAIKPITQDNCVINSNVMELGEFVKDYLIKGNHLLDLHFVKISKRLTKTFFFNNFEILTTKITFYCFQGCANEKRS